MLNRIGCFVLAIVILLALPCVPIFIEFVRDRGVVPGTYLVTASVLSGTFGGLAENNFARAGYALLFVVTIVLYAMVSASASAELIKELDPWAKWLLLSVIGIHVSERFSWHVVYDRPLIQQAVKNEAVKK